MGRGARVRTRLCHAPGLKYFGDILRKIGWGEGIDGSGRKRLRVLNEKRIIIKLKKRYVAQQRVYMKCIKNEMERRNYFSCGQREEPAILISRLLWRMRHMNVWTSTKNEWNAQNAIWSCAFGLSITRNLITRVNYLSRETYAKHNDGAKAF